MLNLVSSHADLTNKNTGAVVCSSQIQITNDPALSCLPSYGGVYSSTGNGLPASAGNFVVPSGSVYVPVYVQQTIIQQFITINNVNINTVIINNVVPSVSLSPSLILASGLEALHSDLCDLELCA